MLATPLALEVPLRMDDTGTIRVGKTRVILDLVIDAYKRGKTPEGIVEMYDVLNLSDVYTVIAYYLQHRDELDAYLDKRRVEAEALRREIEAQPEYQAFRDKMRARMTSG